MLAVTNTAALLIKVGSEIGLQWHNNNNKHHDRHHHRHRNNHQYDRSNRSFAPAQFQWEWCTWLYCVGIIQADGLHDTLAYRDSEIDKNSWWRRIKSNDGVNVCVFCVWYEQIFSCRKNRVKMWATSLVQARRVHLGQQRHDNTTAPPGIGVNTRFCV